VRRKRVGAGARRDPEKTRAVLLDTAFKEIYRGGFQGTGLDQILERARVTKGALYHYFDSKEKLGYAIVDEVIAGINREKWVVPLEQAANPIDALMEIVKGTSFKRADIEGGCPLNNLAQEMSPIDEGFRWRIGQVFWAWIDAIAAALKKGQERGQVRREVNADDAAAQFVAMYEGYISLAKNQQTELFLMRGVRALRNYLEGLRAK
jgi:TetR/AcrR family transcriptional regulator, transcriptional repressor for nem operon